MWTVARLHKWAGPDLLLDLCQGGQSQILQHGVQPVPLPAGLLSLLMLGCQQLLQQAAGGSPHFQISACNCCMPCFHCLQLRTGCWGPAEHSQQAALQTLLAGLSVKLRLCATVSLSTVLCMLLFAAVEADWLGPPAGTLTARTCFALT